MLYLSEPRFYSTTPLPQRMASKDWQVIQLLERNLRGQWSKSNPAWSMSRNVAMFGDGADAIMDTIERLQRYTEIVGIKTQVLQPETLATIERGWAQRRRAADADLSPASSADSLVHCISTLRTVMAYADDDTAHAKERSYRMTLRFNLDEPTDAWHTSTFFVVCYAAHDQASCAKARGLVARLAQWRSGVLDKTSDEYAQRCLQSDGRAIGILVNTAPDGACPDDALATLAARYSFTAIDASPDCPTAVDHLCNRLLIAALRSVDATWAPPTPPYVPRANARANGAPHADTDTDSADADQGGGACLLWPFGWPTILCRARPLPEAPTEALCAPSVEGLRLSSSDFACQRPQTQQ